MKNILLINGHQPFPTSPGKLNGFYLERARARFASEGHATRLVRTSEAYDLETEVESQQWADLIFLQFPVNSMGPPWSLKKYLDEVYTAGMDGRLARGDGRSRKDPSRQYGSGGLMSDTKYMLSATLNAPRSAFDDPEQRLFAGRSVDELLAPLHINFAFFGLQRLPTFAAFDVNKNPTFDDDVARFDQMVSDLLD